MADCLWADALTRIYDSELLLRYLHTPTVNFTNRQRHSIFYKIYRYEPLCLKGRKGMILIPQGMFFIRYNMELKNKYIDEIELNVFASNHDAIKLYKQSGYDSDEFYSTKSRFLMRKKV